MALKTVITRKITDIPPEDWNRVYPDTLEGYYLFKTLDESNLEQFSFYYIMVYDHKAPIGAAAFFLMDYPLDTSISGPAKRVTNFIKKLLPDIFNLRALICGIPIASGRLGIKDKEPAVVKAILRRMESIAKKNRARVIAFKDFDRSYDAVLKPLLREGFVRFDGLPVAELNIRFRDFEDYLMNLSGENRYGLRRKLRKADGKVTINMEVTDTLDEAALRDVYRLYLNTDKKHGTTFELLPMEFFAKILENMPRRAKFFLWKIDEKLVMFLLCRVSKDLFTDCYVGFDYSVAYKHNLYFVQFRDTLRWCIKHGIGKYDMGVTGYETKRRLGFYFVPHHIYVKLRNPALRPVFNIICRFLKFENFDPAMRKAKEPKEPKFALTK